MTKAEIEKDKIHNEIVALQLEIAECAKMISDKNREVIKKTRALRLIDEDAILYFAGKRLREEKNYRVTTYQYDSECPI